MFRQNRRVINRRKTCRAKRSHLRRWPRPRSHRLDRRRGPERRARLLSVAARVGVLLAGWIRLLLTMIERAEHRPFLPLPLRAQW